MRRFVLIRLRVVLAARLRHRDPARSSRHDDGSLPKGADAVVALAGSERTPCPWRAVADRRRYRPDPRRLGRAKQRRQAAPEPLPVEGDRRDLHLRRTLLVRPGGTGRLASSRGDATGTRSSSSRRTTRPSARSARSGAAATSGSPPTGSTSRGGGRLSASRSSGSSSRSPRPCAGAAEPDRGAIVVRVDEKQLRKKRDQELIEILNEVRVALAGASVLFGFLLVVPFSAAVGRRDRRPARRVRRRLPRHAARPSSGS